MKADKDLPGEALQGARLLYAYIIYIEAPLAQVFLYTGDPAYWARDFDGDPLPNLRLAWIGPEYSPGSIMALSTRRRDGTPSPIGAVRMELISFRRNAALCFRYLTGNHLIYRFVYEDAGEGRTEFTVNALVGATSPPLNTLRQRLYAGKRRKVAIVDHLRVKREVEARAKK